MGEHKRRTARSTFEAAAKDRGVPVAIERIKFRGPEEMSALTHALVNHMQVHQRRHHAPPAVQPRYEPYQQADGSLVIYLRSLDVETSFSVARGRWWAMSDGEMAKPDPPSPTIVDEAGLAAAMCADYETLQLRSEQREALYEAAVAALFLFDRSQRSLMALREVVIRRSDIRTAAIQWYEHSDYPYAALYMALDRCWLSSVEEGLDADAPALNECAKIIGDVKRVLLRVDTLPVEMQPQLIARWQKLGGMVMNKRDRQQPNGTPGA
ncbi:MAG: hypothetical protein EPN36_13565 [Rhodanobacteraceae bacterium]|nr:MAG: hypothetical protein EPN36_13565 [Rhodanobacteraceae bacterium]